ILLGICWIQLRKIQILLIEAEDREAPRNVLVVARSNSWQSRLARANHVPSWRDEMHDIAQRRLGDDAVPLIPHHRLTPPPTASRSGPVASPLNGHPVKIKPPVAPHEIL